MFYIILYILWYVILFIWKFFAKGDLGFIFSSHSFFLMTDIPHLIFVHLCKCNTTTVYFIDVYKYRIQPKQYYFVKINKNTCYLHRHV